MVKERVWNLHYDWHGQLEWLEVNRGAHHPIMKMVADEVNIEVKKIKQLPWWKRLFNKF